MATHTAVATIALKGPLGIIQVPTITPQADEVRVRVQWTASTPLDLHQNDGGLLVKYPQVLGDGTAGTVVETGPDVKRLKKGDKVFGFTWREQQEKAHQEFCTAPEWLFALLPEGFTMAEAVTLPNNFVTVFHTLTIDLGIETPWPKPEGYVPKDAQGWILVWGGSSSVGQFAIQILRYYGYENIITTASKKHHSKLQSFGAKYLFDYKSPDITSSILNTVNVGGETSEKTGLSLILDCIGSQEGSVKPIAKMAKKGATVAILLPVIVRDSGEGVDPEYEMDVSKAAEWDEGVTVRGVRTHFYLNPDIMYTMLKEHIVEPNNQKIIEGATLLERAQKAMNMLRRKEASGERLVWRVSDS
ncbi:GroES-like protein [Lindgomyces ingoldianus]|uniref:GroES-like protein n=1 Tax=Lindgomyces ingoldianus TaxID=673940 RepID=A0ACB6QLG3_9PLEO|nr:GroES-like protein [Lindgomyces ingoldianus]KAF2467730.1 GroES-like protein [Lindgomyces ingoldianus]